MEKGEENSLGLTLSERLNAIINLGGAQGGDFFRSLHKNGGDKKVDKVIKNFIKNKSAENEIENRKEAEK